MNIKTSNLQTDLLHSHLYSYVVFKSNSTNNDKFIKSTNFSYNDKTNWYKIGMLALTVFAVFKGISNYKLCKKLKATQKALTESKANSEKKLKELEVDIHKLKVQVKQKEQELQNLHHETNPTSDKTDSFDKYNYISQRIQKERKQNKKRK